MEKDLIDLTGLEELLGKVTLEYQHALRDGDKYASGKLINSVKGRVYWKGEHIIVSIKMADYWKYIEEGVNGTDRKYGSPYTFTKQPPREAILRWIKQKHIGGLPNANSLAFLIGRSIKKKGLKPTHYLKDILNKYNVEEEAKNIITEQLQQYTNKLIKELGLQ